MSAKRTQAEVKRNYSRGRWEKLCKKKEIKFNRIRERERKRGGRVQKNNVKRGNMENLMQNNYNWKSIMQFRL